MNAQFLIARYMPDLERKETRNIGVIVWAAGSVAYRFVEPSDADFVDDHDNYWRWIEYWQELCGQQKLQLYNDPVVTKRTPRFLKALQKTRRGNFLLDFGGEVYDEVSPANVQ